MNVSVVGRDCEGIHFAVNYLEIWQKHQSGRMDVDALSLSAKDKRVIVIGGGDTGVDCIATSLRQVRHDSDRCVMTQPVRCVMTPPLRCVMTPPVR